jgi:hypothetical protein
VSRDKGPKGSPGERGYAPRDYKLQIADPRQPNLKFEILHLKFRVERGQAYCSPLEGLALGFFPRPMLST